MCSCAGSGSWTVQSLTADIESASLCALAEASATAISSGPNSCLAGGVVYAGAEDSLCPMAGAGALGPEAAGAPGSAPEGHMPEFLSERL